MSEKVVNSVNTDKRNKTSVEPPAKEKIKSKDNNVKKVQDEKE